MAVFDHCFNGVIGRLNEYKFQLNLAVLNYSMDFDAFNTHWNQADMIRNCLISNIAPWIKTGPKSTKEMMAQMREQYIATFGDPEDPENKAEMQRLIDHWEERTAKHRSARDGI